MNFSLILKCVYLVFLISFLDILHARLIVPICSVSGLSRTRFCLSILNTSSESIPLPDSVICSLPGSSFFTSCNSSNATSRLTLAIRAEFQRLLYLHKSTSDTPQIVTDLGDAIYAIDDLVILVRNSNIKNKAAILESLKTITAAARQSSNALLAYAARVSSAVAIITSSASHTACLVDVDESFQGQVKSTICITASPFYQCSNSVQESFLRSIVIIQSSINILTQYNLETARSVIILEQYIRGLVDLIGDESHEVAEEIGDLLGRLWTKLGGNRSRLARMNSRAYALLAVGNNTASMRKYVGSVQRALTGLQEATDVLKDVATTPLLLDGALPRSLVLKHLSDGCQALQSSLRGSESANLAPKLHISAQ